MKNKKIMICVIAALLVIGAGVFTIQKINPTDLQDATTKTESYDINVQGSTWTKDGDVLTTVYLGPNTIKALSDAYKIAAVAKYTAKAIDIGQAAQSLSKSYKTGSKTLDAAKDLLNYDELTKLQPAAVAQLVLGWATDYLADSTMQNCLVKTAKEAVSKKKQDRKGGITLYLTTNFLTEKSSLANYLSAYDGWYLYKQRSWGITSATPFCKEDKECIQFLYTNGENGNCGLLN